MLSEAGVTALLMSLPALFAASRTDVLGSGLAVVSVEPRSPAGRIIVRPFPRTEFTSPVVSLIWSLVSASARLTVRGFRRDRRG